MDAAKLPGSAAKVREQPKDQAERRAENQARHDGKIKRPVPGAVNDVAWQAAQPKRKFCAKIEENTRGKQKSAKNQQRAPEIARGVHTSDSKLIRLEN